MFTAASMLQTLLHSCLGLVVSIQAIDCIFTLLGNAVRDLLVLDGEVPGW